MTDEYVQIRLEVLKSERLPGVSRDIVKLLHEWGMTKEPQECLWVIALDANKHIRRVVEVSRGGHADMTVELQPLLTAVLAVGAIQFVIVHNHPTLNPSPSITDWNLTQTVMVAANNCGLILTDHLIVTPKAEFYSFKDAGLIGEATRGLGGAPLKRKAASTRRKS